MEGVPFIVEGWKGSGSEANWIRFALNVKTNFSTLIESKLSHFC